MEFKLSDYDVIIIGAGPAGATAAAMLAQAGKSVIVLERQHFPRFSIGESLLPQCMIYLEEAGLLNAVNTEALALGFQLKNGAVFHHKGEHVFFDFEKKSSLGPGTTYQVKRELFDSLLANGAADYGAEIHHGYTVKAVDFSDPDFVAVEAEHDSDGSTHLIRGSYLLDASGFGRVLPRLLKLEYPSDFPVRQAAFCHVKTDLSGGAFDRNKILITVHPTKPEIWFWLIPFADGTASIGVVGGVEYFAHNRDAKDALWQRINEETHLLEVLGDYRVIRPEQMITGYSANVRTLYGDRFALLGNAGEFLDPVFSSGVTIALKSSSLAVPLVLRELNGEFVDWEKDYSVALRKGISTFHSFVKGWYDTRFQKVIFYKQQQTEVKAMICSILAGYAWDTDNPYVRESKRRLNVLAELCSS
ncbi:FAD-dependent oxidoreductase [Pseudidiomarina salinarum]|uniref:FAD-dependent oxidoreductase n=1 Tax=Pseudidiomarina salinarum TaxID=435908 RepID=A0A094JE91_9GAMM|nr:NAD(P)/FAD-dependent oxidoreductase [Pseudidiomarina salinarum]KFZ30851.1 FAD-dependent oxidoreductase [Pseudidiomarina salinarum]RUO71324.1 NAD(P)/FAD-dependent oxidoreductase [Pseudidiomarina salinarum]